jgi:hypothetical protein
VYKFSHPLARQDVLLYQLTLQISMPRIETRVTSVQIIPGFPACLAIPDPPGWDLLSPQQSCAFGCSPSDGSTHTHSCQQTRGVGNDTNDGWLSSTPDLIWPSDISPTSLHTDNVEILPAPEIEVIGTPIDSTSTTTSYQQPMVSPSLRVS